MTLDHALFELRCALEQAGVDATGIRIVVKGEGAMFDLQRALGGLMSSPNGQTFHALGFKFECEARQHSAA